MTEISALRLGGVKKSFITVSGKRIFYLEKGEGAPVVMIHGWMGSAVDFPTLFPFLAKNFRVLVPDLPGFGESERMERNLISDYSRFVKDFAETLGLGRFFLVGNCFGATIALDFVIRFPRACRRVVLFTPIYSKAVLRKRWAIPFRLLGSSFLRKVAFRAFRSERFLRMVYSLVFRHSKGAYKEDAIFKKRQADFKAAVQAARDLVRLDLSGGFNTIRVPVLVIVFEKDRALVPGALVELKKRLPSVRLVRINRGHFVDPDLMVGEYGKILEFFKES